MSENKSLPVLGTKKVFEDLRDEVFCKIEFVEFIPNLDEYVMNKTKWDVSDKQDESIMAWLDGDTLKISGNGTILANEDCEELFCEFKKVETIKFNGLLNTDNMKNARKMFWKCEKLKNIDLSNWNTRNLENTICMFDGCGSLTKIDLANWNTENLRDASYMFCFCESLENIDLSDWNIHNLKEAWGMFWVCKSLTNIDVSNWNTKNLQDIRGMFCGCRCLKHIDVSNWNTGNLVIARGMFDGCFQLEKVITNNERIIEQIEDKSIIQAPNN